MGDKFEEHMCPPKTQEFVRPNGEKDMFTFQPLGFEYMPKFFRLMKKFFSEVGVDRMKETEMREEDMKKFFDALDDESLNLIKELIEGMMEESYPDEFKKPEGVKKMSKFMAHNMMDLMSIVMEMNSPSSGELPQKPITFGAKNESTTKSNESGNR